MGKKVRWGDVMVKLCAIVPGENDAQKIAIVQRLGLWGTAASLDLRWDAEKARARTAPYHAAGVRPQPFSYHMSEAVPGEGNLDYPTLPAQLGRAGTLATARSHTD